MFWVGPEYKYTNIYQYMCEYVLTIVRTDLSDVVGMFSVHILTTKVDDGERSRVLTVVHVCEVIN